MILAFALHARLRVSVSTNGSRRLQRGLDFTSLASSERFSIH